MNQSTKVKLLLANAVLGLGLGAIITTQIGNVAADSGQESARPVAVVEAQVTEPADGDDVDTDEYDFIEAIEYDPYQIAADAIGIEVDALFEGLETGKTVAEIATENGADVQAVVDALVAAEDAFIDELVSSGELSAEEAAEWKSETAEYINELINESWDDLYFEIEGIDPYQVAADTIGIDIETLFEGLDSGKTVAEIATENGVDVQAVVDALVVAEDAFIDELVASGELSAEEAAEWKSETAEYINELVNESWDDLYFEIEGNDPYQVAADTIGIDIKDLFDGLDSGKTVAEIATENGADVQAVVDALVAAEDAFIDELVASGELSAEEAAEWKSETAEYINELVNESWDDHYFEIVDGEDPVQIAADTIGVDVETLYNAIDSGQTIAEVAAENGVDAQTVIDALVTAENSFIDELVAKGDITSEEANEWRSEVSEYTAEMVNQSWDDLFEECDEFDEEQELEAEDA